MMKSQVAVYWSLVISGLVMMTGCGGSGEEITRVSRQNNSGTYHYFKEAVLGEEGEFKLGSIDLSGSKDVVELVASTPGAIGYSGMGYHRPGEVKMLSLSETKGGQSVAPTAENAKQGDYPLARALYIYTLGEPQGAIQHYLNWILSPQGQKIVEEIGYVPVKTQEMPDQTPPPDGTIKVAGSDTMVNLAQAWAETYMQQYPNVSVQVSGGGSGVGIAKMIEGTVEMANASRDMKEEERQQAKANTGKEVKEHVVALDALAVYVHKNNPLDSISIEELREIYGENGSITEWSQVEGWPKNGE